MVASRTLLLVAVVLVGRGIVAAQTTETGFLNRSVILDGGEYPYQTYVPREYKRSVAWPIILALHGAGERGSDGLLQTEVGLVSAIPRHADRYPAESR
jgi:predicted peptidase